RLRERADALRAEARTASGDEWHVAAIALIAEAIRRTRGLSPYDVQPHAGLTLAAGQLAEMATGEGKTLDALLPAFCFAPHGHGRESAERDTARLSSRGSHRRRTALR